MAAGDLHALAQSELNHFLFATVGLAPNGNELSVISMLARLGEDPWVEAGRLAKLPKPQAIDSLAGVLARAPDSGLAEPETRTVAARLVALLPSRTSANVPPRPSRAPLPRAPRRVVLAAAAVLALMGLASALDVFATRSPQRFDGSDVASFNSISREPIRP